MFAKHENFQNVSFFCRCVAEKNLIMDYDEINMRIE